MALAPAVRVIADDLTGACEMAALGFRRGLPASVCLGSNEAPSTKGIRVLDSETRLLPAEDAADRIRNLATAFRDTPSDLFYKKTDSVLRGPVAAELQACMSVFGADRVLFIPVNPALGRVIRDGCYFIGEKPLHETDFANDPHHPAHTSDVVARLREQGVEAVFSVKPSDELPKRGILVADAVDANDLRTWTRRWRETPGLLAAGGAAWAEYLLDGFALPTPTLTPAAPPPGPTLLLSGTRAHRQHALVQDLHDRGGAAFPLGHFDSTDLSRALSDHGGAAVYFDERKDGSGDATAIRADMAALAREIIRTEKVRHLVIEGGATAASVAEILGWTAFAVVADWGGGVVTLAPSTSTSFRVTLKPGSYPWPEPLHALIFGSSLSSSPSFP